MNIDIEIYSYTDGNNVVHLISDNKEDFDILFLDIDMPILRVWRLQKKFEIRMLKSCWFLFPHMSSMYLSL